MGMEDSSIMAIRRASEQQLVEGVKLGFSSDGAKPGTISDQCLTSAIECKWRNTKKLPVLVVHPRTPHQVHLKHRLESFPRESSYACCVLWRQNLILRYDHSCRHIVQFLSNGSARTAELDLNGRS